MKDDVSAEVVAAYAAGIFDGEGCVTIAKKKHVMIGIGNVDLKMIEWLQRHFGGQIYPRKTGTGRQIYYLHLTTKESARAFLEAIQPYSIVKLLQIQVALAFIELRNRDLVYKDNYWVVPDEQLAIERSLDEMLRMLKKK